MDKSKEIPAKIRKLQAERREHTRIVRRHRLIRVKALTKQTRSSETRIINRHLAARHQNLLDIRALRAEYHKHNVIVRRVRNNRTVIGSSGLTWVDGHQVSSWIAKILFTARKQGVNFYVTSGIRTLATATYLWNNAGRLGLIHYVSVAYPCQSNHCGFVFPKGAVDLSPWEFFLYWLRRQHSLGRYEELKSYHDVVGSRDNVHFSHTGH